MLVWWFYTELYNGVAFLIVWFIVIFLVLHVCDSYNYMSSEINAANYCQLNEEAMIKCNMDHYDVRVLLQNMSTWLITTLTHWPLGELDVMFKKFNFQWCFTDKYIQIF